APACAPALNVTAAFSRITVGFVDSCAVRVESRPTADSFSNRLKFRREGFAQSSIVEPSSHRMNKRRDGAARAGDGSEISTAVARTRAAHARMRDTRAV